MTSTRANRIVRIGGVIWIAATLTVLGASMLEAGRQDRPSFRSSTRLVELSGIRFLD